MSSPTREEVWRDRSAPNAFPTELLKGARTAASFFSAAFYGRNDVIYLANAGITGIVLVDLLEENLAAMEAIFPEVAETYVDDAFAVARKMAEQGRRFDVVVCDPFTDMTEQVLFGAFDVFAAVTGRLWVTGMTADGFARAGIPQSLEGVQSWLDASDERRDFEAVWLKVRNSSLGVCWLGLRRRRSWLKRLLNR